MARSHAISVLYSYPLGPWLTGVPVSAHPVEELPGLTEVTCTTAESLPRPPRPWLTGAVVLPIPHRPAASDERAVVNVWTLAVSKPAMIAATTVSEPLIDEPHRLLVSAILQRPRQGRPSESTSFLLK
ncbi:hypothetical protein BN12_990002 [Nostocoides japonicum T1-X7]|uniref:Uncharacterized protein n=1 Tax=Nostocoides japonicum T1-X7 TaxID=1194083 RepID=A0A077M3W4_9MICO|nr:hypothetical protein BN12_990002 [Tetrasphaera japonica T1-X7]